MIADQQVTWIFSVVLIPRPGKNQHL